MSELDFDDDGELDFDDDDGSTDESRAINMYSESWLYSSGTAATPLFEGSSTTVLQALVRPFHMFSSHPGISKEKYTYWLCCHVLDDKRSFPHSTFSSEQTCDQQPFAGNYNKINHGGKINYNYDIQ